MIHVQLCNARYNHTFAHVLESSTTRSENTVCTKHDGQEQDVWILLSLVIYNENLNVRVWKLEAKYLKFKFTYLDGYILL